MPKSKTASFDTLVEPHLPTLFRVAYRLVRNTADAQDLVQDTCVIACSSLDVIAAADSPLRWLLRVQQNRFIDGARRQRRSPVQAMDSEDLEHQAAGYPDPGLLSQHIQNEQLLEHAFLQLDESQRTLLSLRAEGYDLPEIEAITGIAHELLSKKLFRARASLAQRLTEQGAAVTVGRQAGSKS